MHTQPIATLFLSYLTPMGIYDYLSIIYNSFSVILVEDIGVEPMTSCVQGRRSSQLS